MVALGEVGAADGALKQHITDQRQLVGLTEEDDVAWRMAGAVQHLESLLANGQPVTFVEPEIRGKRLGAGKTKHFRLGGQGFQPEGIGFLRSGN